jgi:HlyD family secretion protein
MLRSSYFFAVCLVFSIPSTYFSKAFADVSALGRLEPHNGVFNLTAPVIPEAGNGLVLGSLHVVSGQYVEAGQLLAVTESNKVLEALKNEADTAYQFATKDVLAADALADAECVRAAVSRREADRRSSLLDQNLSSLEESERASADAEFQEASCLASRKSAEASLSKVDLAKSHLELRVMTLSRTYVYAPVTGRVLNINTWPGEAIGPAGILEFGQTNQMYAIAEIYETDIHQVKVNQKATISSTSLPQSLSGVVEHVRPMIRKQDVMGTDPAARKDARVVEVEIRIDSSEMVESLTNLQVEILIES